MIPARRSPRFVRWFERHAAGRIGRAFGRVYLHGLEHARAAAARAPLLVVANHTSWWDPLVALWTASELGVEAYAMMDARNLVRLPFFGLVGAFGVDLGDARDGARAVRYAAKLLDRPGRAVWIFPEGRERWPFGLLELEPGAAHVARLARGGMVLPIGVRYVFAGNEAPDLWISIGAAFVPPRNAKEGVAAQREAIGRELARIDAGVGEEFDLALVRKPSLFGSLAERLLAALTRPRLARLDEAPTRTDAEPPSAPVERRPS